MEKFTIKDNTVSSANQVINSSDLYYLGNKNGANLKVLIMGNSITRHGPCEEIGWKNDWGMAASLPENDYVHVFFKKLQADGYNPYFMVRQASFWERNYNKSNILEEYKEDKDFGADIFIFRLGENVADVTEENYDVFLKSLRNFTEYLVTTETICIFTTCFWGNGLVDKAIKEVAENYGGTINLNDLGASDEMRATGLFWHTGVAGHPGDKGMNEIAERIYVAVKNAKTPATL